MTSRARNYSEATAIEIDSEVRRIVTDQYARARQVLLEHRDALERIARALLQWETLEADEVEVLVKGGPLNKTRPPPAAPRPLERKRPEVKEKSKILDALGGLTAAVP